MRIRTNNLTGLDNAGAGLIASVHPQVVHRAIFERSCATGIVRILSYSSCGNRGTVILARECADLSTHRPDVDI